MSRCLPVPWEKIKRKWVPPPLPSLKDREERKKDKKKKKRKQREGESEGHGNGPSEEREKRKRSKEEMTEEERAERRRRKEEKRRKKEEKRRLEGLPEEGAVTTSQGQANGVPSSHGHDAEEHRCAGGIPIKNGSVPSSEAHGVGHQESKEGGMGTGRAGRSASEVHYHVERSLKERSLTPQQQVQVDGSPATMSARPTPAGTPTTPSGSGSRHTASSLGSQHQKNSCKNQKQTPGGSEGEVMSPRREGKGAGASPAGIPGHTVLPAGATPDSALAASLHERTEARRAEAEKSDERLRRMLKGVLEQVEMVFPEEGGACLDWLEHSHPPFTAAMVSKDVGAAMSVLSKKEGGASESTWSEPSYLPEFDIHLLPFVGPW